MQAARLVDYSDSEDDEEMEWREYQKQRSVLRVPKPMPPAPTSVTEEESSPPPKSEPVDPMTPDRDFAFTPRKRASRFRSRAADTSSSFSRKPASTLPSIDPNVDFSFSSSATASPMSDGETKPWASPSVHQQASGAADVGSGANRAAARRTGSFTFGAYNSTEAAQSASTFAFGSEKAAPTIGVKKSHTAFAFDSQEEPSGATSKDNRSPPFTFGAFTISDDGIFSEKLMPRASFLDPTIRRSDSLRVDGKTPRRQKDLHRAAKRRVGGSVKSAASSSFRGSASSTKPTPPSLFSPFMSAEEPGVSHGADNGGKGPTRKPHSPMDIEMDENASSSNVSAFSFDVKKSAPAPAQQFSFGTPSLTSTETTNPFRVDPKPSNGKPFATAARKSEPSNGVGREGAFGAGTDNASKQFRAFFFGSSSGSFSESTTSTRDSKTASPFTFRAQPSTGMSSHAATSSTDAVPAMQTKSASFSFESAFKDYDVSTNPWASAQGKKPEATNHYTTSVNSDGTTTVSAGRENGTGRESLEVRMARRKQAREAKAALDRVSGQVPLRPVGAQKVLFQSGADTATCQSFQNADTSHRNIFESSRSGPSFTFGQNAGDEKLKTSVFQRAPSTTSTPFSPAPSNPTTFSNTFSFKSTSSFTVDKSSKGGIFTFGTTKTAEPEPNPSPPPVDHLKSNFDGFNIGIASKATRSKSAKASTWSDKGHRVQPTVTSTIFGEKDCSPFEKASMSGFGFAAQATNINGFIPTPPADPFVTPIFGQKNNDQRDAPMQEPEKESAIPSPFAPNNPSHSRSIPVFGKSNSFTAGGQVPQAQSSNAHNSSAGSSPFESNGFSMGTPATAFLPGRRILRATRPVQRQSQPTNPTNPTSGDESVGEETHRGWSEWKSLGGSAYTKRAYQEAADCYLNSIIVLENLLNDQPELKTDQLMKDKSKLHCNRAAALMMLLQLADAQRECYLSLESDAAYTRAYMRLGRIQVMLGDTEGAKESSATAKQLLAMSEPSRRTDISDAAGVQKIEVAVEKLEKLRVEIKWCLDVHDYSRALSHLQEALAVAPHCRSLQTQKAHALFEQKNYAQVVEYCTGVVRKQKVIDRGSETPETPAKHAAATTEDNDVAMLGIELSMLRIRALHCENKVDDAMHHMHKLELAAPCSAKVIQLKRLLLDMKELKHQANELFKRGDYEQAQQTYSQALQLDPTNDEYCAVIYCNRAAALMGLQQYENALHDCNAALRRKARYPRCLLRRARCNVALKRYAAAIADFDRYLKEHRSDSSSSTSFYEVDLERQKVGEAMEAEAEERRRKEEQQKKDRQKSNGRSKTQHQQQRRQSARHAWDDSKFYEDFWRSSSSGAGGSSRQQSSGARGRNASPAKLRRTHYDVLGVVKSATQDEIKKAYRKLALLHHPDKAKDTAHADLFKEMTAAYNILSDPAARAKYDREIHSSGFGRYNEY